MGTLRRILVVNDSKVVRATLAKQFKGHVEIREELNGESAWQTLVLDSSIEAVIASVQLSKLSGLELLERVRENRLRRLSHIPFFLLVSDSWTEQERQKAEALGVSGLFPKSTDKAEVERLRAALQSSIAAFEAEGADSREGTLPGGNGWRGEPEVDMPESLVATDIGVTNIGVTNVLGPMGLLPGLALDEEPVRPSRHQWRGGTVEALPEVHSRQLLYSRMGELLGRTEQNAAVGVLLFGLDNYDLVAEKFGITLANKINAKFTRLLTTKIRTDDTIGMFEPGKVAIVAAGTTLSLCAGFAERICKALSSTHVAVAGERITMTVSVGIASMPEDGVVSSADELFSLANYRLSVAASGGGNRVVAAGSESRQTLRQDDFLRQLRDLMAAYKPGSLAPSLGMVGLELLPLIKQLDTSFRFGLPLADIERRLKDRARAERLMV